MSDENNNTGNVPQENSGGAPQETKGNAALQVLTTLKNNPKALYALLGAVAAVSLVVALSGGGDGVQVKTGITPGQTVALQNPNGGETQLNTIPGLVSVAVTEEDEKQIVCHVQGGTSVVVEEEQVIVALPFVKVQVKEGPCQGKSGWVSKINIQAK
jgi:hypothetical protein